MRGISLNAVLLLLLLGGCAASGTKPAHVLSGDAPMENVLQRAGEAAAKGDHHAASILYQQALRQEPQAEVWYRLGVSLAKLDQPGQAMGAYRQALALDPDHVESLQAVGFYLTTKDRPAEAKPYLQRLLAQAPDNWRAHNALGVLADLRGEYLLAGEHYAAAIERHPESPMLWNNLGFSHYLAGNYGAAVQHIGKALQIDPRYKSARYNIALVLARQSRYDEALQMMMSASEEPQAYCDVGYLAFKMGDLDTAERLLTEAIRRSGTYYRQAHQNLAAVRQAQGDPS